MGNVFVKKINKLKGKKNVRMVLLGLDSAGKTTILYMLKLGDLIHTIPTIGFNVETIKYKNLRLDCWDAGGQEVFRGMWKHYCQDCHGIIFVVDSSDPSRFDEAKLELHRVLSEDTIQKSVLLVIANKQDAPGAVGADMIANKLELEKLKQPYHVQPAVATNGEGLIEGLDWMVEQIKNRSKKKL
jgi:ADP-ribosylation factor protein 1